MPIVAQEYIEVDARGVAKIAGSRSKVRQVVLDRRNGLSPEGFASGSSSVITFALLAKWPSPALRSSIQVDHRTFLCLPGRSAFSA